MIDISKSFADTLDLGFLYFKYTNFDEIRRSFSEKLKTRRKQFLLIRVSRTDYEYYNADPKTGLREDTFNGI